MDIVLVIQEILCVANSMIRKSSLPDFSLSTENRAKGMGVSAFDKLDRMFERNVICGSESRCTCSGIMTKTCS